MLRFRHDDSACWVPLQARRSTVRNALHWPAGARWRLDCMNPDLLTPEELARRGAENERAEAQAQALRDATLAEKPARHP